MMPLFEQVLDKYPTTVKIVYKNFPLAFHKQALSAALAALAAGEQGRFWEYHDALFLRQNSLSDETYLDIARNMGLDMEKFSLDIMRPSLRKKIELDMEEGKKAGISGTPTIFVNGRKLRNRDLASISKMIDEEIAGEQKK
jgi:protein-disulfide isomerase